MSLLLSKLDEYTNRNTVETSGKPLVPLLSRVYFLHNCTNMYSVYMYVFELPKYKSLLYFFKNSILGNGCGSDHNVVWHIMTYIVDYTGFSPAMLCYMV